MFRKIKIIIQIIVIILIVLGLGYYFYFDYQKSKTPKNERDEIIDQIADLDFIKEDLTQEEKDEYQKSLEPSIEKFVDDPENPDSFWALIKIAQVKELAGDYEGAKQALLWAFDLSPESYLVNGNLANLYFRHDQNFVKAEEHYLKAIQGGSFQAATYYGDLHEIYRYFYKQDTSLAEDILKEGIERTPGETSLMFILAYYYRDMGRQEEAKEYFQRILEINPESQVAKQGLESL